MRRSQWLALLGVALLLGLAVTLREYGVGTSTAPAAAPDVVAAPAPDLRALRAAADLAPCPAGLGAALPDVTLPCLGGGADVALRAAAPGRPTLVNLWAYWCGPCQRETPALVAFSRRAGDRVGVVGIVHDDQPDQALKFNRDFGVHYPSVVDSDGEVLRGQFSGLPVTLFLDAAGRIAYTQRGPFTDLAQLESLVAEHLGVQV